MLIGLVPDTDAGKNGKGNTGIFLKLHVPPISLNTISSTYQMSPLIDVAYSLSCHGCLIVVPVAQGSHGLGVIHLLLCLEISLQCDNAARFFTL